MRYFKGPMSTLRWRTRLVLWLAATIAGLVVVGFAKLADVALRLFFSLQTQYFWLPVLLAPAAGMATVWLTRYFRGAEGSGIPQVIAATRQAIHGQPVDKLVSLRIAFGKVGLGALTFVRRIFHGP